MASPITVRISESARLVQTDRSGDLGQLQEHQRLWQRELVQIIRTLANKVNDLETELDAVSETAAAVSQSVTNITTTALFGTKLHTGTGNPSDSLGSNGDFYLRQVSATSVEIWGPKTSGTWSLLATLS